MTRKQMLSETRAFVEANDLDLQNATLLLGGAAALRRFQSLRRMLRASKGFEAGHKRELRRLFALLSLEHVHDPDREESGFFAEIGPDDPVVWSICMLTDQLGNLLASLEAGSNVPVEIRHAA